MSPMKSACPRGATFRAALVTIVFFHWVLAAPTKERAAVPQVKIAGGARVRRRRYMMCRRRLNAAAAAAAGVDDHAADVSRCFRQRR